MPAKKKTKFNPYVIAGIAAVGYYLYTKKKSNEMPTTPTGATLVSASESTTPKVTTTTAKKKKTVKETVAGYLPSWLSGGSVDYGY